MLRAREKEMQQGTPEEELLRRSGSGGIRGYVSENSQQTEGRRSDGRGTRGRTTGKKTTPDRSFGRKAVGSTGKPQNVRNRFRKQKRKTGPKPRNLKRTKKSGSLRKQNIRRKRNGSKKRNRQKTWKNPLVPEEKRLRRRGVCLIAGAAVFGLSHDQ